jgi:SAM-dependent methyltransferase
MKSPLTGCDNCTVVKRLDPFSISDQWRRELGIFWNPPPELDLLLYCYEETTGFYFYWPDEAAGCSDLYSQLQRFPWYYMEDKWEFKVALQFLQSLPFPSKVLEIGSGQGAFLEKGRTAGLHISGMELNLAGAQAAKEKGFTILEKDMAALNLDDPTPWDAICAFQVLEHLANPRLFLDQAINLLKPGGLLILSVPNAEIARKLDPDRTSLLDQPPHHMSHWDQGVFRSMETFLPLKLKHLAFEPLASYHIGWFIGSLSQRLRKEAGNLTGKLIFNRLTIPVAEKALGLGLRYIVRGHTLLACFEKSGPSTK